MGARPSEQGARGLGRVWIGGKVQSIMGGEASVMGAGQGRVRRGPEQEAKGHGGSMAGLHPGHGRTAGS